MRYNDEAMVAISSIMYSTARVGVGFWLTGKLGRAWVGAWVHGMVHGVMLRVVG